MMVNNLRQAGTGKRVFYSFLFCLLSMSVQPAVQAQGALEEILVTAQKREQSLTDVPLSVSVVTGEALRDTQFNDLRDLAFLSPSLVIQTRAKPSDSIFFIRGIGTVGAALSFEQSVGVYIDGVIRGRAGAAMQDLIDLERIEILRGPQATIFGRNNSGGAINVTTAKPGYEPSGNLEVTYGDENLLKFRGSYTGALVENKVAFRISGSHHEQDGHIDNPDTRDLDVTNRESLRAQLLFDFSEDTSLRLIGDYAKQDDLCCQQVALFRSVFDTFPSAPPFGGPAPLFGATVPPGGTPSMVNGIPGTLYDPFDRFAASDTLNSQDTEDWGFSGELNHDFGGIQGTLLAAYREFDSVAAQDIDGGDGFGNSVTLPAHELDETTIEARLTNSESGALDWLLGIYYFNQDISQSDMLRSNSFRIPFLNPEGVIFRSASTYKVDSIAGFGQADWHVSDRWTLSAGLRYLSEESTADINTMLQFSPPRPPITFRPSLTPFPGQSGVNTVDGDELMGSASLTYKLGEVGNLYARYGRGFKSGGVDLIAFFKTVDQLDYRPETVDAYEIGAKLRLLDNTLLLNGAVFYQELSDQQVQTFTGTTVETRNAAESTAYGFELEYIFSPAEAWLLTGGLAYVDSTYDSFPDAPAALFTPTSAVQDLADEDTQLSPDLTVSGSVQYTQPLAWASWYARARMDYRYQTDYYTNLANDPIFENGDTFTLDLSLQIYSEEGGYGIQFWGKNVTDEEIIKTGTSVAFGAGSAVVNVNDPATWGITAFYRF